MCTRNRLQAPFAYAKGPLFTRRAWLISRRDDPPTLRPFAAFELATTSKSHDPTDTEDLEANSTGKVHLSLLTGRMALVRPLLINAEMALNPAQRERRLTCQLPLPSGGSMIPAFPLSTLHGEHYTYVRSQQSLRRIRVSRLVLNPLQREPGNQSSGVPL